MGFSKKSFSFCFKKNRKASQWAISTWSKCTSKSYILKNGTSNDKEYVEDPGGVRSLTFAAHTNQNSRNVKRRDIKLLRIMHGIVGETSKFLFPGKRKKKR